MSSLLSTFWLILMVASVLPEIVAPKATTSDHASANSSVDARLGAIVDIATNADELGTREPGKAGRSRVSDCTNELPVDRTPLAPPDLHGEGEGEEELRNASDGGKEFVAASVSSLAVTFGLSIPGRSTGPNDRVESRGELDAYSARGPPPVWLRYARTRSGGVFPHVHA